MSVKKAYSKKLRIMWNSNAPWSISGYGNQMAELLPLITKEGYQQACIDFYGLEGGKLMLDSVLHYPKINHVYGSDAMWLHGQDFNADVTFSLQDIWVLNGQDLPKVKRWIPICPVDHDPVPKVIVDQLRSAYRVITYSKFGQEQLRLKGINSTYIPHTVDTTIFKPLSPEEKKDRKINAGLPQDSFIVGMVAANKDNPPRKSFQEAIEAFAVFLQKVPNALLYIHTLPEFPGGFPIKEYATFLHIGDHMLFPDAYQMGFNMKKEQMAKVYGVMDMLLMPSRSEGFGVPAIEAQACGVPVVVNNFTSMPELVQKGVTGEVCEVIYKQFSHLLSYIGIPSSKSIYDCMMRIKQSDRALMGQRARAWIVENYDTHKVFTEKWIPFLEKLEREVYPEKK